MLERPDGIPGSGLTGPWAVGQYAARLRGRLREFARVQVFGEVFGFKAGRAKVWFELRDGAGALPCSMWREDWDRSAARSRSVGICVGYDAPRHPERSERNPRPNVVDGRARASRSRLVPPRTGPISPLARATRHARAHSSRTRDARATRRGPTEYGS